MYQEEIEDNTSVCTTDHRRPSAERSLDESGSSLHHLPDHRVLLQMTFRLLEACRDV